MEICWFPQTKIRSLESKHILVDIFSEIFLSVDDFPESVLEFIYHKNGILYTKVYTF